MYTKPGLDFAQKLPDAIDEWSLVNHMILHFVKVLLFQTVILFLPKFHTSLLTDKTAWTLHCG